MIGIIVDIAQAILGLLIVVLIVHVVISWLYAFDIVSRRNDIIAGVWRFTSAITDPVLRPLRRMIPPIAGVDLSVMVLILILILLRDSVLPWLHALLVGNGSFL